MSHEKISPKSENREKKRAIFPMALAETFCGWRNGFIEFLVIINVFLPSFHNRKTLTVGGRFTLRFSPFSFNFFLFFLFGYMPFFSHFWALPARYCERTNLRRKTEMEFWCFAQLSGELFRWKTQAEKRTENKW